MPVLDDAIALEKRAQRNYNEAIGQVNDPSGKKILAMLAEEEQKHAQMLEEMKGGSYSELKGPSLVDEVRGMVESAVEGGRSSIFVGASMRDVLQRAMEIEQTTKKFYEEHAVVSEDVKLKELFEKLASLELAHYQLVSSLATYYDRPSEWVESAEFGLRPEY